MDKELQKKAIEHYLKGAYTVEEASEFINMATGDDKDNLIESASEQIREETMAQGQITEAEHSKHLKEASALLSEIKRQKRKFTLRHIAIISSSAAAILIALVFLFGTNHIKKAEFLTAKASVGEQKSVILSDGTKVTLNSCSEITYPSSFEKNTREVVLSGEAYFDVTKNPKVPFCIKASRFEVKVLGTVFNIKSYSDDDISLVDVESGCVEVSMPEAVFRLKQNDKIIMNKVSGDVIKSRSNAASSLWTKEKLCFEATPLCDVARMLERQYGCKIDFEKGQDFNILVSGQHDNKSLESVLKSISFIGNIKFRKEENTIILYK